MEDGNKTDPTTDPVAGGASGDTATKDHQAELAALTDKWKRALAEAENIRKRADAARLEGREHGIAAAVEALAPAFDAVSLTIEAVRSGPDKDTEETATRLKELLSIEAAIATGLRALGVRTIAARDTRFDPKLHDAVQVTETDKTSPGEVLVVHRPGFALGQRLIRPAHVTVSATPGSAAKD